MSYEEVAKAIGKNRTTIYDYERICNPKNLGKTYEIYLKLLNEIRNQDSVLNGQAKDDEVLQI